MDFSTLQLVLGFILAALIASIGWKMQALNRSGALGATLIGGFVFGFGGLTWAALLVAFFLTSSLFSQLGSTQKRSAGVIAKAGPRDFRQTMANGGVALLMALAVGFVGNQSLWYPYLTLAYFGSLAAATADTWATELGMLSSRPPRLIISGDVVQPGVSGGVTPLGMLASLGGGLFLALMAFSAIQAASLLTTGKWFLQDSFLLLTLPLAGLLASLFDSILGATLQQLYYCERCQVFTETPIHQCGATAYHLRGIPWMNNDLVNFLSTCMGALTAILISLPFLAS